METMYTTKFQEGEVALSETEQGKCWLYMYYSSGVRCYNKEGALINPFDEHPEYYTVDIRHDFHTIIYELCVAYQDEFPEPSEKDVLRILQKGQALSLEEKRSNPDWCKVKYVYKRRPEPGEKQKFVGGPIEAVYPDDEDLVAIYRRCLP